MSKAPLKAAKTNHDQLILDTLKELQSSMEGLHSYITKVEGGLVRLRERFNKFYPEHRNCVKCGRIIPTLKKTCKFCSTNQPDEVA